MHEFERNDAAPSVLSHRSIGVVEVQTVLSSFENRGWNPRPHYPVPATPSKNNQFALDGWTHVHSLVQIGEGSSSRVYAATSAAGQPVAVKIFYRDFKKKRDQEWNARVALPEHRSLVHFYDRVSDNSLATNAIIMELCSGGKLSTRMSQADKRDPQWNRQVQAMLGNVSVGLSLIHRTGYIHLDVKPDNILMTGDGKYKLADFGKMKSLSALRDATKKNLRYGDVRYAAPEVYRQDPGIHWDGREDVYSLGIVAVEMMYDISPNSNEKDIPHQLVSSVDHPSALCKLIMQMLATADRRISAASLSMKLHGSI